MLAAKTLKDFRKAIDMLILEEDAQAFRVLCVAAASLNRSIGYALQNSDDPDISQMSNELYYEWKKDENCIFNTFIHRYRNHVFHDVELDLEFDIPFFVIDRDDDIVEFFDNELLYVPFSDFGFGDLDIRDLFEESYSWWLEQGVRTFFRTA